jgi:hypothetical protein
MAGALFYFLASLCPTLLSVTFGVRISRIRGQSSGVGLRRILVALWVAVSLFTIVVGWAGGRLYTYVAAKGLPVDSTLPLRPALIIFGLLLLQSVLGVTLLRFLRVRAAGAA